MKKHLIALTIVLLFAVLIIMAVSMHSHMQKGTATEATAFVTGTTTASGTVLTTEPSATTTTAAKKKVRTDDPEDSETEPEDPEDEEPADDPAEDPADGTEDKGGEIGYDAEHAQISPFSDSDPKKEEQLRQHDEEPFKEIVTEPVKPPKQFDESELSPSLPASQYEDTEEPEEDTEENPDEFATEDMPVEED